MGYERVTEEQMISSLREALPIPDKKVNGNYVYYRKMFHLMKYQVKKIGKLYFIGGFALGVASSLLAFWLPRLFQW